MQDVTFGEVSRIFGGEFAEELAAVPLHRWSGPVLSGFGLHIVRVSARSAESLPTLDEVRSSVEREWLAARRAEANRRFFESLRANYAVEVNMPEPRPDGIARK